MKLKLAIVKMIFAGVLFGNLTLFSHHLVKAVEVPTSIVHLRILETTDLHGNIMNFDYKKGSYVNDFGLVRTASLIKKARKEAPNSLLFDNGDLLQGNELMDYVAMKENLETGKVHPMFKAMNILGYDAATFGNHDFHYGLPFLNEAITGANFPYVNANMLYNMEFEKVHLYKPYVILNKEVIDINGMKHNLKVGVIGFITPFVTKWEEKSLMGRVMVEDIIASAEECIPRMKKEGADIIVALAHTGLSTSAEAYHNEQNAVYPLSKVSGIDAILFGHTHAVFPDASKFKGQKGINNQKGTINGVPAIEAGSWGNYLGIVDLILENINGKWQVIQSQSIAKPIFKTVKNKKIATTKSDQQIIDAVRDIHKKTIHYLKKQKASQENY